MNFQQSDSQTAESTFFRFTLGWISFPCAFLARLVAFATLARSRGFRRFRLQAASSTCLTPLGWVQCEGTRTPLEQLDGRLKRRTIGSLQPKSWRLHGFRSLYSLFRASKLVRNAKLRTYIDHFEISWHSHHITVFVDQHLLPLGSSWTRFSFITPWNMRRCGASPDRTANHVFRHMQEQS